MGSTDVSVGVPLHITGFWSPRIGDTALESGSRGAGLVIRPLLRVQAEPAEGFEVILNGSKASFRTLEILADKLGIQGRYVVDSPAPLGAGFAVSAATAIGVAYAWSRLSGLDESEAARAAHEAEVEARTGLGDVVAILQGSHLEIRIKPGGPGVGVVSSIEVPKDYKVVAAILGSMDTRVMLESLPVEVYQMAEDSLARLESNPSLEVFLEEAYMFSKAAGMLTNEVEDAVESCRDDGLLGFFVKKRVLAAVIHVSSLPDFVPCLRRRYPRVMVFEMCRGGVRVGLF